MKNFTKFNSLAQCQTKKEVRVWLDEKQNYWVLPRKSLSTILKFG